jgi:hypothetical protein
MKLAYHKFENESLKLFGFGNYPIKKDSLISNPYVNPAFLLYLLCTDVLHDRRESGRIPFTCAGKTD